MPVCRSAIRHPKHVLDRLVFESSEEGFVSESIAELERCLRDAHLDLDRFLTDHPLVWIDVWLHRLYLPPKRRAMVCAEDAVPSADAPLNDERAVVVLAGWLLCLRSALRRAPSEGAAPDLALAALVERHPDLAQWRIRGSLFSIRE